MSDGVNAKVCFLKLPTYTDIIVVFVYIVV